MLKDKNFCYYNNHSYYSTSVPPPQDIQELFIDAAWFHYCPHVLIAAEAAVFSQSIKFFCIHKIDYGHMTEKYDLLKQIYAKKISPWKGLKVFTANFTCSLLYKNRQCHRLSKVILNKYYYQNS